MKLRKIFASVIASAIAVAAMATVSNALIYIPESVTDTTSVATGLWLVQIYNDGTKGDVGKAAVQYDFGPEEIASIQFTIAPSTKGDFQFDPTMDCGYGGGVVISCGNYTDENGELVGSSGPRNWNSIQFWGILDNTAFDQAVTTANMGDGTWTITWENIPEEYRLMPKDAYAEGAYAQIGLQEWGSSMVELEILELACYDAEGNCLIAFNGIGEVVEPTEATLTNYSKLAMDGQTFEDVGGRTAATEAAPEEAPEEETTTEAATEAETTTTEAPAATTGSNNTMIIIIIIAAVVVVAVIVVVVVVAKKKK